GETGAPADHPVCDSASAGDPVPGADSHGRRRVFHGGCAVRAGVLVIWDLLREQRLAHRCQEAVCRLDHLPAALAGGDDDRQSLTRFEIKELNVSETVLDHGYVPEEHAPDPVISHGDPTPPGKVAIWLFLASEVMFFIAIL